jgi:nucleotide-binding universal stress UspA family protein
MREQAEARARDHLNASLLAQELTGVAYQAHLRHGHVGVILPAFIETEEIDLVVMGSLTRTGIAGLISGSAAEQIFYSAYCAVLVVKPPNFVSPVVL